MAKYVISATECDSIEDVKKLITGWVEADSLREGTKVYKVEEEWEIDVETHISLRLKTLAVKKKKKNETIL